MIKIENVIVPTVEEWKMAVMAARNPMNSWDRSDSGYGCEYGGGLCSHCSDGDCDGKNAFFIMGPNDHDLMMRLAKGGPVHATYRRMLNVYLDVTAPLYFWKEADRYSVGKSQVSCSTMHKIQDKEFTLEDFSCEHLEKFIPEEAKHITIDGGEWISLNSEGMLRMIIHHLNFNREKFLETKDKKYWWQMIQLLPSSYNQKRTIMLNYEVLVGIYRDRKNHKLDCWREFCKWIETLPYSELITTPPAKTTPNIKDAAEWLEAVKNSSSPEEWDKFCGDISEYLESLGEYKPIPSKLVDNVTMGKEHMSELVDDAVNRILKRARKEEELCPKCIHDTGRYNPTCVQCEDFDKFEESVKEVCRECGGTGYVVQIAPGARGIKKCPLCGIGK